MTKAKKSYRKWWHPFLLTRTVQVSLPGDWPVLKALHYHVQMTDKRHLFRRIHADWEQVGEDDYKLTIADKHNSFNIAQAEGTISQNGMTTDWQFAYQVHISGWYVFTLIASVPVLVVWGTLIHYGIYGTVAYHLRETIEFYGIMSLVAVIWLVWRQFLLIRFIRKHFEGAS